MPGSAVTVYLSEPVLVQEKKKKKAEAAREKKEQAAELRRQKKAEQNKAARDNKAAADEDETCLVYSRGVGKTLSLSLCLSLSISADPLILQGVIRRVLNHLILDFEQ